MEIGDVVEIKECHKIPDLVGKKAKIVAKVDPEKSDYPLLVELLEPIEQEVQVGTLLVKGPFGFREDELELAEPDKGIPDAFLKE